MDQPLKNILGSNSDIKGLNIPIFQRPYSWGNEQISQFLNDFDAVNIDESNRHFYGLIVYVKNDLNPDIIDIIDGQQRLTTIIIFLSIIRDLLEDMKNNTKLDEDSEEQISVMIVEINLILRSKIEGKEVKFFTENESKFENDFLKIIQKSMTSYKNKNASPRKMYEEQSSGNKDRFLIKSEFLLEKRDKRIAKHKNSYKNYISLYDHIKEKYDSLKNAEERYKYLNRSYITLTESFRIIPFQVESYERAFEYFEVLNDRGLDVSALDLIKNQCLKGNNISASERENMFNKWSDIFSNTLDQSYNLIQFVRYAYMSDFGHITNKKIFSSYKEIILKKNYEETISFLENNLHLKARIYKDLSSNNTEIEDIKIHNIIQLLRSTKTSQWISLAMGILDPLYDDKKISNKTKGLIISFLEILQEIMFSLNFIDKVANEIEKKLPDLAKEIVFINEEQFNSLLETKIDSIKKIRNDQGLSFKNINLDNVNFMKNNYLGSMLLFLFEYKFLASSSTRIHLFSLEHTLPQKATSGNWPEIESGKNYDNYIYSYGNFLLTHSNENSKYSNRSFKEKKKLYEEYNMYDPIPKDSELNYANVDIWSIDLIKKREDYIKNKFQNTFQQ